MEREREMEVLLVDACTEFVEGVASRDVQLEDSIWVRIFLPQDPHESTDARPKPVVLYVHGGAYTVGEPNWYPYHTFCASVCKLSQSIWVSLSYRQAPTHRIPAAFDDGALALRWLHAQALQQQTNFSLDPWLSKELADFSNVFLAGDSAGANIMLKVAMDSASTDFAPLHIKGLLLVQPGFHSEDKRDSALDEKNEKRYNRALPIGENLDYAPINPMHPSAPPLTPLAAFPHIFISAAETDFRYDMTTRFYDIVRDLCPHVQLFVSPGKGHAFQHDKPHCPEAHDLHAELASFIRKATVA